ncbi:MAG TPA: hypothetical protein VF519_08645 [Mycobacteriales bacterium]|jgi:hypothetical protein
MELVNAGDAGARTTALTYFAERDGTMVESGEARDLLPVFEGLGVDERDYLLVRLTPGGGIGAGSSHRIMELPLTAARAFQRLGVVVTYAGPFGERTALTMEVHPPHGLPT